MKHFFILIFCTLLMFKANTQGPLKNSMDIRFGYGGIDGLSGMTFLSAAYGLDVKRGFILKGNYLKGTGFKPYSALDPQPETKLLNIYGISLQKAVNTSGSSSINLALGYRYINQSGSFLFNATTNPIGTVIFDGVQNTSIHNGVDVDLSYTVNIHDRVGVYAGANFTTGISMFSVNLGSRVYF